MLISHVQEKLEALKKLSLKRNLVPIDQRSSAYIYIKGKALLNFGSNDYLGIGTNRRIKKAFSEGASIYGLGSGGSPLVSGYSALHQKLEEEFSCFLNRDKALLFSSGYHANMGVITALGDPRSIVISDKLCHASLLDGIQLSRAQHIRYAHNNVSQAETILQKYSASSRKIIVTEGVFSMEGDISPMRELVHLSKRHKAFLIVDDAHGIGVLGDKGQGVCDYYCLSQEQVPCLIAPLGKAFGSMGAVVSGSESLIESLKQFAKSYKYTTALPPAISYATLEALKIIKTETWRRDKLSFLISCFIQEAKKRSLSTSSIAETPIKSIVIGDEKDALKLHYNLLEKGFFVPCIRPPTVPRGTARLRVSLNCMHQVQHIKDLLDHMADFHENYKKTS
jgi:8-amino-7-oxononanoate synthase